VGYAFSAVLSPTDAKKQIFDSSCRISSKKTREVVEILFEPEETAPTFASEKTKNNRTI
jgi:hypothetical protein